MYRSARFGADPLPIHHTKGETDGILLSSARRNGPSDLSALGDLGAQVLTQVAALQNRKNTTGRMELKKYNKYLKRVTVHKEIK